MESLSTSELIRQTRTTEYGDLCRTLQELDITGADLELPEFIFRKQYGRRVDKERLQRLVKFCDAVRNNPQLLQRDAKPPKPPIQAKPVLKGRESFRRITNSDGVATPETKSQLNAELVKMLARRRSAIQPDYDTPKPAEDVLRKKTDGPYDYPRVSLTTSQSANSLKSFVSSSSDYDKPLPQPPSSNSLDVDDSYEAYETCENYDTESDCKSSFESLDLVEEVRQSYVTLEENPQIYQEIDSTEADKGQDEDLYEEPSQEQELYGNQDVVDQQQASQERPGDLAQAPPVLPPRPSGVKFTPKFKKYRNEDLPQIRGRTQCHRTSSTSSTSQSVPKERERPRSTSPYSSLPVLALKAPALPPPPIQPAVSTESLGEDDGTYEEPVTWSHVRGLFLLPHRSFRNLDRDGSRQLLRNKPYGTYMLRLPSKQDEHFAVLAIRGRRKVQQVPIDCNYNAMKFRMKGAESHYHPWFASLDDMLRHYTVADCNGDVLLRADMNQI